MERVDEHWFIPNGEVNIEKNYLRLLEAPYDLGIFSQC